MNGFRRWGDIGILLHKNTLILATRQLSDNLHILWFKQHLSLCCIKYYYLRNLFLNSSRPYGKLLLQMVNGYVTRYLHPNLTHCWGRPMWLYKKIPCILPSKKSTQPHCGVIILQLSIIMCSICKLYMALLHKNGCMKSRCKIFHMAHDVYYDATHGMCGLVP